MLKPTDVRVTAVSVYFLPIQTRVPLKFGPEITTGVTCARVALDVVDRRGHKATGWGETPLSVQWVWPSALPYATRLEAMRQFCLRLAQRWACYPNAGHPLEIGYDFHETELAAAQQAFNAARSGLEPMPWLAALVCCSAFDLALHDAFGQVVGLPIYQTYGPGWMNRDLSAFLSPAEDASVDFRGRYPMEFLTAEPPQRLIAWHLVGGLDPLDHGELTGNEPKDGYPVLLEDWIERDGLKCLKVKLRGTDRSWDYGRLVRVGQMAVARSVDWLSADFNCTVTDPNYVVEILDTLRDEHPRIYGMVLYVEQPFPYELSEHRIDAHAVAARKPLFLDESAHDWRQIRLGRELGWTGVALKTCKTQTGAILSACWARAHGMTLMVQDLTNPMIAQIPHLLLAANAGTIMGVETNSMQFYPEASKPEAAVHPGLFKRQEGQVDLSSLRGPGFGYRLDEIHRELPPAAAQFGG